MKTMNVNVTKWSDEACDWVDVPMMGYVVSVEYFDDETRTWVYVPGYLSTGSEYWTVQEMMHARDLTDEEDDLMWDELGEDVMVDMEPGYAIPVWGGGVADDEEQSAYLNVRTDSAREYARGRNCVRNDTQPQVYAQAMTMHFL